MCACVSIMPGITSWFRALTVRAAVPAMRDATRAILPSFTATSWTPSMPEAGSITRPPRTIRSNFAIASLLVRDRFRREEDALRAVAVVVLELHGRDLPSVIARVQLACGHVLESPRCGRCTC